MLNHKLQSEHHNIIFESKQFCLSYFFRSYHTFTDESGWYPYFGKGRGLTIKSFIDESSRLFFSTVFSSSEREAAYVFDGLLHNEVVKSDIHSTDTHGYSEVIFGTAFLLGLVFAPRIKNVQDQQLYSFKKRKLYEEKGVTLHGRRCGFARGLFSSTSALDQDLVSPDTEYIV